MDIQKIQQVWARYRPNLAVEDTESDPRKLYQHLASVFCPGPCFYYVYDLASSELDFVSPEYEALMGYPSESIGIQDILEQIHPRDVNFVMRCEEHAWGFLFEKISISDRLRYVISYCLRLQVADGEYRLFLHQSIGVTQDEQGHLGKVFCVNIDISHITFDNPYELSFLGLDGAPSFMGIEVKRRLRPSRPTNPPPSEVTAREIEVLRLLAEGARAQDIARLLNIAEPTARKHRENLLKKLNARNTAHLIATAIRKELI